MADDELAEINGIKPKVLLADNEEKEFRSTSRRVKSVYKIKRTFDHYYCSCPAWRNQAGVPVNARTCKHLLEMLGLEYETARLELKNPDGPPPKAAKGSSKKTSTAKKPASTSKAKPSSKRKKVDEDEDEEEEEEEEEEEKATSTKKPASRTSARKPSSKRKKDDEEEEETKKPASRASTRKPPSKRKKADEDDEEEETKKPVSKASTKPSSKAKGKAPARKLKLEEDIEEKDEEEEQEKREEADADAEEAKPQAAASSSSSGDELAEINGIKPKVVMKDGDETEVKSQTSNSSYKVKRTWDHYYCTCPAWRNQGGHPVNARTCKHLRSLLGDAYEDARLKFKNPHGPVPTTKSKPGSKGKGKRKKADDDDDDDGDGKPASKRAKGEDDDAGKKPELLLANKWDIEKGADPTGWWVSEKLDGVRTFYDGKKMYSRLGNLFTPPTWFLDKLPKDCTLDGELFSGRGDFQSTVSIVKTMHSPHWGRVEFHVFDIPSMGSKPFEERYAHLQKLFGEKGTHASDKVKVVEHEQAKSRQHVLDKLKEVETLGGEGLMLRKAGSLYEGHRSGTLLKIKTFYDAEAVVVGHDPGKGRNAGVTGALKCKMESGKLFNVGTGLSDKQRKNPPKIGSIIVYRFQELTKDGVPRFPSFIGEAADKTEPKDAEVPEHRKGGAKKGDDED
ncbi:hypothetical protein VKT23_011730 [Stygiomarasmius scandens]|uniref:SWIM-type domain-containing protein n=1 Tax=Marasmiellus scandens TaxID=2682957 RepID=A0ABR1J8N0_9AGAR